MVNKLTRFFGHLCSGPWAVRARFPQPALDQITAAIRDSELKHRGEIRFAAEGSLTLFELLRGISARDRAVQQFAELNIWDTEENCGVLIYLLIADRDIEIVVDRGLSAVVAQTEWDRVAGLVERRLRAGEFAAGVVEGIRELTEILSRHFPATGADKNELPDEPQIV